ncbi:lysine N(6)-hydroxylase/L-ornithine N(5)-oxygenase family protein [Patulibacter minatonensis]|uniref:lysine N(6)-hydroxylase/L-ornithine N(5)-oxygenase family protein n=1 Tax=Patulibacter minatonensis TaxID=298163 RepID=UPI00056BB55D|nr:SidA/IucD/PvdA family monooxygenase [Patulibacter minatonensis]
MSGTRRMPDVETAGIGFGPSNLALAIAIHEDGDTSAQFFERKPEFAWHRGMLIDDATMQVSFLKDLATMRNPSSDFSFVSFLHQEGRLVDFINYKTLYPLRIEFHAYLEWAAARVDDLVTYGHEVVDVVPVEEDDRVVAFDVVAEDRTGDRIVTRARNVVLAAGLTPVVPEGVECGPHVWHTSELLHRIDELKAAGATPERFAVVGAGQSAAEAVAHLHREFEDAEVCGVFSKFGYTPADDSAFANRIFDPDAAALFHGAPPEVKDSLIAYHRSTNYSVVDGELIESLYREHYRERVLGNERLRMLGTSRIETLTPADGAVDASVVALATGDRSVLTCDAVVYATGYRPIDPIGLLGTAGELCRRDADGLTEVLGDNRLALHDDADAAIFLQGAAEHAFGLTSTLLSMVAVRAGQVFDATKARRTADAKVGVAA